MPTAYRNKIYIKNKLSKQWQINYVKNLISEMKGNDDNAKI